MFQILRSEFQVLGSGYSVFGDFKIDIKHSTFNIPLPHINTPTPEPAFAIHQG